MARARKISPHEWISDYFSPIVTVLSSADADDLCAKNNLSLAETLQPFSKLIGDVTARDPENTNQAISGLAVNFLDFKKDPSRLVNQKLLFDIVDDTTEVDEPMVSKTFSGGHVLEAPGYTPWFDAWSKLYIHSVPAAEHEFVRHHVGCLFAVSTSNPNVVEEMRNLVSQQHRHLLEKANLYPQYITPTVLKYYLLLHDPYDVSDAKSQEAFTQLQSAFGSSLCHFLPINSRSSAAHSDAEPAPADPPGHVNLVDHWLGATHRFLSVETRREGIGSVLITTANSVVAVAPDSKPEAAEKIELKSAGDEMEHPLAVSDHPLAASDTSESPPPPISASSKFHPVTRSNIASRLASNDTDRIRIFVREFVIKGLIPHMERQMRVLHDAVTNKKSRSLFSGAKRWFGQGKPGSSSGTSVVYSKDTPELQLRKLADFYFMLKMYKSAYNCYHSLRKDFQADEAWNYYAGATEMSALALFMQSDSSKKYPTHYMEDCILKYLQVCQMPEFAVRATLFDTLCLKSMGMFQEAAISYIRLTNETKELRSSLLLEQAAYCFLLSTPPCVRKYGFHIILSAYRYSKSGQKKHSARAYRQGFQVYKSQDWGLAEDHILYNLGHQTLLLKDHYTAATLFNDLLARPVPNANSLQQMCHLREFFIVHHLREREDKQVAVISIPKFLSQECVLEVSGDRVSRSYDELLSDGAKSSSSWHLLEKTILERVHNQELLALHRTCQTLFTPATKNNHVPQAAVGEVVRLVMPVKNLFQTALLLKKIHLIWKFIPEGGSEPISNERSKHKGSVDAFVQTDVVESLTVEKEATASVALSVVVLQPGELWLVGAEYGIRAQFPQSEATDYTIHGKQYFKVKGPRLKTTKEHKTTPSYGRDTRLQAEVKEKLPQISLDLSVPETLLQTELQCFDMVIRNVGSVGVTKLVLASQQPGMLSFGSERRNLFDFPIVFEQSLSQTLENGEHRDQPLDFLLVPLPGETSVLEPGQDLKIPLWLRAAENPGSTTLQVHLYCEQAGEAQTSVSKRHYRILSRAFPLRVLPCLTASAMCVASSVFKNAFAKTVTLSISNLLREPRTNVGKISVLHVSLLSQRSVLSAIQSRNEDQPLTSVNSLSFSMTSASEEIAKPELGFHVSDVCCAGSDTLTVRQAPYWDFVKTGFHFAGFKNLPSLTRDMLVVFWRAGDGGDAPRGQLIAPVMEWTGRGEESETVPVQSPCVNTKVVCDLTVSVPASVEHDFTSLEVCGVACSLQVRNPSLREAKFCLRVVEQQGAEQDGCLGCTITGCYDCDVVLQANESLSLPFRAVVTAPGLYTCRDLAVQMLEVGDKDNAQLVPVVVEFVVSNKTGIIQL